MILETPKGKDDRADRLNLTVLRYLAAGEELTADMLHVLWSQYHGSV
jgi:hypothetical protein